MPASHQTKKRIVLGAFFAMSLVDVVYATTGPAIRTDQLPASVLPGIVSKEFMQKPKERSIAEQSIASPQEQAGSLGPEAAKIHFVLTKIILEGNHIYSDAVLSELYRDKLHHEISVSELQAIVLDITNYYRNNGYIISRAILPPQHVQNGIVKIKVIEGYLDKVTVSGDAGKAKKMLERYGNKAIESRPLQLKTLEHYLYLANDIPGIQTRAVLNPSKTNVGAAGLDLVTNRQAIQGSFAYDNYGTRYLGPQEATGRLAFNSLFLSGDTLNFLYSATPARPKQLGFYDLSWTGLMGSEGLSVTIDKNYSRTRPGFVLTPAKVNGNATNYYAMVQYPIIRERSRTLTLDGSFNYLDSLVTSFNELLYIDHLRTLRGGGTYAFADKYRGSNLLSSHVEQGLPILGASSNVDSFTTSRFGGRGTFTKLELTASRLQAILGPFSVMMTMSGQYALNPLLASEQYAFGGSIMGRGYDPAEIVGDRGLGGTLELRADFFPEKFFLANIEPYIFYDEGAIWNLKNVIGVLKKQSIASAGGGIRFVFTPTVTGNLMIGQPLTKQVAAEELIGRGRLPRGFFSLVITS